MSWGYETFVAPLQQPYFLKALLGGCLVAITCGVVGCLVVLRRMAFLGDALSHSMIAGVAAGYLFMKLVFNIEAHAGAMLLGALFAAVLTVALIAFVTKATRIKDDSAIGIMYVGVFAAGAMLISTYNQYIHIDLVHFVLGDILGVADHDLWNAAIAGAIVLSAIVLFFRHFQLASFDPVMAASIGLPVLLIDYALTTCVSLVVVSAISMVGMILVIGLLITPAATAYLLTDRLKAMMWLAAGFGVSSIVGGLYLCEWTNTSGGAAIMVFCTLQFMAVLMLAPRYGLLANWLRKRRRVPQELLEDILRAILKAPQEALPKKELYRILERPAGRLERTLAAMRRDGLIEDRQGGIALTTPGQEHALRVMRAHRLWESYLKSVGMPEHEIDARAHELEHIYDEHAIDYIDHKLGHPLTDPHGSEIPPDFIHLGSGEPVLLSILRKGQRARVVHKHGLALDLPLEYDEVFAMLRRRDNGQTWVIQRRDGSEIPITHAVADDLVVEVLEAQRFASTTSQPATSNPDEQPAPPAPPSS